MLWMHVLIGILVTGLGGSLTVIHRRLRDLDADLRKHRDHMDERIDQIDSSLEAHEKHVARSYLDKDDVADRISVSLQPLVVSLSSIDVRFDRLERILVDHLLSASKAADGSNSP